MDNARIAFVFVLLMLGAACGGDDDDLADSPMPQTPFAKCIALWQNVCPRILACGIDDCSPEAECLDVVAVSEKYNECLADITLTTCAGFTDGHFPSSCAGVSIKRSNPTSTTTPTTPNSKTDQPDGDATALARSACKTNDTIVTLNNGTVVYCMPNHYGLIWEGTPPALKYTYSGAQHYCDVLTLTNRPWRLPTIDELDSIANLNISMNRDTSYGDIPGQPQEPFWSSTPASDKQGDIKVFDFNLGLSMSSTPGAAWRVRCASTTGAAH